MNRRGLKCVPLLVFSVVLWLSHGANATEFALRLEEQVAGKVDGVYRTAIESQSWDAAKTAVIICDMWDAHHCYRAVMRATEMADQLDRFVDHARNAGSKIIHAPSSCMAAYENHPARLRAMNEPKSLGIPKDINQWCYSTDRESPDQYPIDQSDGGEDDTAEEHANWAAKLEARGLDPKSPWKKQMDAIKIDGRNDFISDKGDEIWSILSNRSIENVIMVGVHTNMCVLGRPFGLRQLSKNGMKVVLVKDLTDSMYNPGAKPFVSHFTGTDLIISYIQRHVCPTITSNQLLGGDAFRFSSDTRPTIAFMIGEDEYQTEQTLPRFAVDHLGKSYRVLYVQEAPSRPNHFVGLDALNESDVLLISVRRKPLPPAQLGAVKNFVRSGKPVVGIRTASHAFCLRDGSVPQGFAAWPEFDAEVFGGNYTNHYGNSIRSVIRKDVSSVKHPILSGADISEFSQGGSLYRTSPLAKDTQVLLTGSIKNAPSEPVAWTFRRADGGVSFYTSLGHADDFGNATFNQFLTRAVEWAVVSGVDSGVVSGASRSAAASSPR